MSDLASDEVIGLLQLQNSALRDELNAYKGQVAAAPIEGRTVGINIKHCLELIDHIESLADVNSSGIYTQLEMLRSHLKGES